MKITEEMREQMTDQVDNMVFKIGVLFDSYQIGMNEVTFGALLSLMRIFLNFHEHTRVLIPLLEKFVAESTRIMTDEPEDGRDSQRANQDH